MFLASSASQRLRNAVTRSGAHAETALVGWLIAPPLPGKPRNPTGTSQTAGPLSEERRGTHRALLRRRPPPPMGRWSFPWFPIVHRRQGRHVTPTVLALIVVALMGAAGDVLAGRSGRAAQRRTAEVLTRVADGDLTARVSGDQPDPTGAVLTRALDRDAQKLP